MSTVARLPLEPRELAKLSPAERGGIYRRLALARVQVEAAEAAVGIVLQGITRRRR